MKAKIHIRDIRFRNNAGIDIPLCNRAYDVGPLKTFIFGDKDNATCKHCNKIFPKRYPWAK